MTVRLVDTGRPPSLPSSRFDGAGFMALRKYCVGLACAAAVSTMSSGALSAQTYSAYANFNLKQNPSSAWSYLVAGDLLTQKVKSCASIAKFLCWWNGQNEPD